MKAIDPAEASGLLDAYLAGPAELRQAVQGLTDDRLRRRPVGGAWSTLEVLCHLADSEALFAERMKRILAEDRPALPFADPNLYVPALACHHRDAQVELALIELTRKQIASILKAVPADRLSRVGVHDKTGPCTLEDVLAKAVAHLRHHLAFIREKREALGLPPEKCQADG